MKPSKRNQARLQAKHDKYAAGKPKISKFEAKRKAQLQGEALRDA